MFCLWSQAMACKVSMIYIEVKELKIQRWRYKKTWCQGWNVNKDKSIQNQISLRITVYVFLFIYYFINILIILCF